MPPGLPAQLVLPELLESPGPESLVPQEQRVEQGQLGRRGRVELQAQAQQALRDRLDQPEPPVLPDSTGLTGSREIPDLLEQPDPREQPALAGARGLQGAPGRQELRVLAQQERLDRRVRLVRAVRLVVLASV